MKRKSTKELGTLKMSRPRKKKEMTIEEDKIDGNSHK